MLLGLKDVAAMLTVAKEDTASKVVVTGSISKIIVRGSKLNS